MFDDSAAFQKAIIGILDTIKPRTTTDTQGRYLLDIKAYEWGCLIYTTILLTRHFFPTAPHILTRALVEAKSSQTSSYIHSLKRVVYSKEVVDWFMKTIFNPTLDTSSGRQNNIDGRQFTQTEEGSFPKNLLNGLSEFRDGSQIEDAITATRQKHYHCYQDRAEAIREKLGIKKPTTGLSIIII